MKKRALIIAIATVAILTLAVAPLVYAGVHRMHAMGAGMGPLAHLAKAQQELGLSDQQVEAIKAIVADTRQQNAALRDQLHGGLGAVIDTLIKDPNDIAGAQSIIDQQDQAERTMKTNMLNAASQALNVLTPDQRVNLGTLIAQHRAQSQHRF